MITTEEARKLAEVNYLPSLIRETMDECLQENKFDLYTLAERLFFNRNENIRNAAKQELDDLIAEIESPLIIPIK